MKISKAKLRQIIKEELSSLKETLWDDRYDDVERMRPRRQPRNPEHVKQDEERREKDREHKAWLQRRKDRGLDEAGETALNSPRQAGREWSYENLANTVGDLVREALEGHGLEASAIRDAIAEALDEELGPVQDEEETIRDEPEDPFAAIQDQPFGGIGPVDKDVEDYAHPYSVLKNKRSK